MQIFGRSWEDIQVMQQGGPARRVDLGPKPEATDGDKNLLAVHGVAKLRQMGYWGVIDRLTTSGLI